MPSTIEIMCTAKQRHYLHAVLFDDNADLVVYGGSRGSGKTYIDCLALVLRRLMHPGTKGLIVRRTQGAADQALKTVIDKVLYTSLKLPRGSVAYRVNDKRYLFPNGSEIKLGYCKLESDYEQYMSAEYADIAFEELTQHQEQSWNLVGGSNRSNVGTCKAKRQANCNPGGVGHSWVKDKIIETKNPKVLFIPSLPADNMALLENDPGYIRRVLDPLPDWQRRQWKEGDWNAISGAYFTINPGQVRKRVIPYWAEWTGGTDWGRAAPFATLFIARWQDLDGTNHCHVAREIYKRGLELDEQAGAVLEVEDDLVNRGELNAEKIRYYADPSTGKQLEGTSTEAGRTIRSTWARHGFYVLAARTNARVPGWQLLRLLLFHGILTIDPSCHALLKELRGAVYEGTTAGGEPTGEDIDPDCPDHACFVAGTLITTDRGDVPIEDLRVGDRVLTRDGYRPVRGAGLTSADAEICSVELSNGRTLSGTGNHPVWTNEYGWVRLDTLRYGILLQSSQPYQGADQKWTSLFRSSVLSATAFLRSCTLVLSSAGIPIRFTPQAATTTRQTGPSRETLSTTKTSTRSTMTFPTSNVSPRRNIFGYIRSMATSLASILLNGKSIWLCSANGPKSGTQPRQATSGTRRTQSKRGNSESQPILPATIAENLLRRSRGARCGSVLMPASPRGGARPTSMWNRASALSVKPRSTRTNISEQKPAPVSVRTCCLAGRSAVYNLSVEGTPEYFANGVLVHNCDALRYNIVSTFRLNFTSDQKNPWELIPEPESECLETRRRDGAIAGAIALIPEPESECLETSDEGEKAL